MKKLTTLFCLFLNFSFFAQQHLEGIVYDAQTKEPLLGAAVFYEGTTLGTVTDEDGKFIIDATERITSQVVISYLGYKDQIISYSAAPIKVYLEQAQESLDEVVISTELPFTRKEMLKAFREQFLGRTSAGTSCYIKNEAALSFYYDIKTNSLHADADESLVIVNRYLGYEIRYRLYKFQVDFVVKSLSPFDEERSYFAGTSFYKDLKEGKRRFKRRRAKAYRGSSLELMRIIATKEYNKAPYTFYKKRFPVNPENLFKVSDTLGIKKVIFEDQIQVVYNRNERSGMKQLMDYTTIDGYGNHLPNSIVFTGIMGAQRLGDSLPLDYGLDTWNEETEFMKLSQKGSLP